MTSKIDKHLPISYPSFVLVMIIIAHITFFAAYGLQKHSAFQTAGFDLGIWDQKMWTALRGYPFVITTQHVTNSLGDHVDPAAFLLLPLYALLPNPQTLIIAQVVLVALGVLPVYWLARYKLRSELAGLTFAVVYLLFPALESAITFDFHGITVAVPFLAYALWAMHLRYYRFFLTMIVMAMLCQEDVPLLTFLMGVYILLIQRNRFVGGIAIAASLIWFAIANFLLIPIFSSSGDNIHLYRYEALGDTLSQVIINILTRPDIVIQEVFKGDKLFYWVRLTMPTAFTALLDPLTLLMSLPSLLINTLSTYPPTYQLDRFHSSAPVIPFVVVASINGLARLTRWVAPKLQHVKPMFLQNSLLAMILIVSLIYQVRFGHTPIGRYFDWPVVTEHHRKAESMLAQIPAQAVVAAQNNLVTRLSRREWIFILPKLAQQGQQAEYIAFDMQGDLIPYDFIEDYCYQLAGLLVDPNYGLILADDGLLLFKREAPDAAIFEPMPSCP